MRKRLSVAATSLAAAALVIGLATSDGHKAPPVATTAPVHCHLRGRGLLVAPDRRCTPGQWIDDGAGVCSRGYNPRPPVGVTGPIKRDVMRRYGIPLSAIGQYELDHLFPVWLGGATTEANLWPELNLPRAEQRPYVLNPKDRLEGELYRRVCWFHSMSVGEARAVFAGDWRPALRRYAP